MKSGRDGRTTTAVYEVAVQTADPVAEVGAGTHALGVGEEGEGGGAVGGAGGFDVGDFLTGGDDCCCGVGDVWEAD